MNNPTHLRTGGDPRALPDYVALRDEMMKLSHPARPDVDWKHAETLCLRLLEHNGVELQTTAWFTLARMHTSGLAGMNEGLALAGAPTALQWSVMWPVSTHGRMEIIAGISQRLVNVFRTLSLNTRDDLTCLYQSEKCLTELGDTLGRHALKQVSGLDALLQQVRQAITRLENAPQTGTVLPTMTLPPETLTADRTERRVTVAPAPMVYVVPPAPAVEVVTAPPADRPHPLRYFAGGVCSALLAGGLMLWGWQIFSTPSPEARQLTASLTPLPAPLNDGQLKELAVNSSEDRLAAALIKKTRNQLKWLISLPPGWSLQYGQKLITQSRALWPDNPEVARMQMDWQQQIAGETLPASALNGWHEGMSKLQALGDRLNALDEKRGKYMTVSELKTAVYSITRAFNQTLPAEERLRRLAERNDPTESVSHLTLEVSAGQYLRQLQAFYALEGGKLHPAGEKRPTEQTEPPRHD